MSIRPRLQIIVVGQILVGVQGHPLDSVLEAVGRDGLPSSLVGFPCMVEVGYKVDWACSSLEDLRNPSEVVGSLAYRCSCCS